MSQIKSLKAVIQGRVQGIGYRWFVQDNARKLKISGWVSNLDDGSVEVEAEGGQENLDKFLKILKNHQFAVIASVETQWQDIVQKKYTDFTIKF